MWEVCENVFLPAPTERQRESVLPRCWAQESDEECQLSPCMLGDWFQYATDMETTQMPINRGMNKENVLHA